MKASIERNIKLGFGSAVVALILIGATAWWSATRYQSAFRWVEHTHQVLNRLERLLTDILSMQTSTRGFVITGSEEVLQPYRDGDAHVDEALRDLRTLTMDNPAQQRRLDQLVPLLATVREIMSDRIAGRRANGLQSASDAAPFLAGQKAVQDFRHIVVAMETAENDLLRDRLSRLRAVGRLTLITILIASGFSVGVVAIAGRLLLRDLAARTAAEEGLRHNEARLKLMIDSVKDYAIIALDPGGRIMSWNAGAHRIKGYTETEILGQHFSRFYPKDGERPAEFSLSLLARAAAEGRVEDEGWRVRQDGSRFWANVVITALHDSDGKLVGFVKFTRDLTAQHKAAAEIATLNEDLVRRATLLEAANRELEAFSYSVSHDLRAPLRHIDGFSNLLAKRAATALDEESKRYVNTISQSAKKMGALIDDLLAFSRIGRTPLRRETINHRQLVNDTIADARYDTEQRRIIWEIGELPNVVADLAMLRQVWRNLLDNAVKYSSGQAAPRIALGGNADAAAREYVFFVRDNGVGFDMAYADKLFGVFQRLHGVNEFEGTGIGLANVRRIVSRHGGRTWAEGRVGEGATFFFSLPLNPPLPPISV